MIPASFQTLPTELKHNILVNLPLDELTHACSANRQLHEICNTKIMRQQLVTKHLPGTRPDFDFNTLRQIIRATFDIRRSRIKWINLVAVARHAIKNNKKLPSIPFKNLYEWAYFLNLPIEVVYDYSKKFYKMLLDTIIGKHEEGGVSHLFDFLIIADIPIFTQSGLYNPECKKGREEALETVKNLMVYGLANNTIEIDIKYIDILLREIIKTLSADEHRKLLQELENDPHLDDEHIQLLVNKINSFKGGKKLTTKRKRSIRRKK